MKNRNIIIGVILLIFTISAASADTYSAVYGKFIESKQYTNGLNGEITNITINVPVTSYVYVSATGWLGDSKANLYINADTITNPDWTYPSTGAFSVSGMFKLKAGKHTIYLSGINWNENEYVGFYPIYLTVIASQKGNYICDSNDCARTPLG